MSDAAASAGGALGGAGAASGGGERPAAPRGSDVPSAESPATPLLPPAVGEAEPGGPPGTPDAGDGAADDAGSAERVRVFLAGDSIVQSYADTPSDADQAGWGQMLPELFDAAVSVENRAIGGRTARRFIDEGRLDALAAELLPGDYLLVQFGTNDGNRTATYALGSETIPYYLEPATAFKSFLERYVEAARDRRATPVFVTPTPRNSAYCTGGNGTGAHALAMRELGVDLAVPVVDLNARALELLRAICPAPSPEDFFLLRADGSVDGTHFQERGARALARLVADELDALGLLSAHRRAR